MRLRTSGFALAAVVFVGLCVAAGSSNAGEDDLPPPERALAKACHDRPFGAEGWKADVTLNRYVYQPENWVKSEVIRWKEAARKGVAGAEWVACVAEKSLEIRTGTFQARSGFSTQHPAASQQVPSPSGRVCQFDPALVSAALEATNKFAASIGRPATTHDQYLANLEKGWQTYGQAFRTRDQVTARQAEHNQYVASKSNRPGYVTDVNFAMGNTLEEVQLARARCEVGLDSSQAAAPVAQAPTSPLVTTPALASPAPYEATNSVLNALLDDAAVDAKPGESNVGKQRKPLTPSSLTLVSSSGNRCMDLRLENFRVDEYGNAAHDFVLTNKCNSIQIAAAQIGYELRGSVQDPPGLVWFGTHPDWQQKSLPNSLGFVPQTWNQWHYLMWPNYVARGSWSAKPGEKLYGWVASCDAYVDGYYMTMFQADANLSKDDRVACVKNIPGAPR